MQYFWLDCEYMYINFPNPYFTVAGAFAKHCKIKIVYIRATTVYGLKTFLKMLFQVGDLGLQD